MGGLAIGLFTLLMSFKVAKCTPTITTELWSMPWMMPVSNRVDQLVQLMSQLSLAQLAAHMVVMVVEMATQMMSVTLSTILDALWTPIQHFTQPKLRTSRAAKKHVRHNTHLLHGINSMGLSPAFATTMDNAIAMPTL